MAKSIRNERLRCANYCRGKCRYWFCDWCFDFFFAVALIHVIRRLIHWTNDMRLPAPLSEPKNFKIRINLNYVRTRSSSPTGQRPDMYQEHCSAGSYPPSVAASRWDDEFLCYQGT